MFAVILERDTYEIDRNIPEIKIDILVLWVFLYLKYKLVDLWCLMPLSIIFQLYWWRNSEYLDKTADTSQVTDELYHIIL